MANRDTDGASHVIPGALACNGAPVSQAIGAASARFALPAGPGESVRLAATDDCYIKWGDSTVVADLSSEFFPYGAEYFRVPNGATHLAVIGTAGTITCCNYSQ